MEGHAIKCTNLGVQLDPDVCIRSRNHPSCHVSCCWGGMLEQTLPGPCPQCLGSLQVPRAETPVPTCDFLCPN